MSLTIAQAMNRAFEALAGLPSPRSDAEELLGRLTGLTRPRLHLERDRMLAADAERRLDDWIGRRRAGEPVQYITGRAAFRHLDLAVTRDVLIPRPETEGLVEAVLGALREAATAWPRPRVLDLGTGSGAIALAIASEWPSAEITATDASEPALDVARANAETLGLKTRVRFLLGEWFDAVEGDARFEVVVSNPPYIAGSEWDELPEDVRGHEPPAALLSGEDGLDAVRLLVDDAPRYLVAGGLLALELSERRAALVAAWLEGARDWQEVTVRDDLAGRPRVLLARREAGPAIAPRQWPEA